MHAGVVVKIGQISRVGIGFCGIVHVQAQVIPQYISIGQLIQLRLVVVLVILLAVYLYLVLF